MKKTKLEGNTIGAVEKCQILATKGPPDGGNLSAAAGDAITVPTKQSDLIIGSLVTNDNVLHQKRAEKDLKDSERQYQNLIQNLPEAIYTCDAEGHIILYNKAAVSLWGKEPVSGKDLWFGSWKNITVDGVALTGENCPMTKCLKEGRPVHGNLVRVQCANEMYRYLQPYPTPVFNTEGELIGAVNMLIDVTEKRERELLVLTAEERYRIILEQASDAIFVYSLNGTIDEYNKACYTMLGYSKNDFAKLELTDILVDDSMVLQARYAGIPHGGSKTEAKKLMRKDGTLIDTEVTVKLMANGKAIAFAREVTEWKAAEKALIESENFNRSILTSIEDHIAVVNRNGEIVSVNKAWDDFSINNGEQHLHNTGAGSNYITVCKASAEQGDALAAAALHGFYGVLNKELPFFEMEYPCHSATEQRWFLLRVVNFADDSTNLVMMHIDISDLVKSGNEVKRLAERLQMALTSAGMGIWDWDVTNNYLLWDEGMYRLYGIDSHSTEPVYESWISRLHPADVARVNKGLALSLDGNKSYDTEFRIIDQDGAVHSIKAAGVIERDGNGTPVRMIGLHWDITERIPAQQEINNYKLALDASSLVDISDSEGIMRHVNKNFCNLSQYSAEELVGHDHRILNSKYHPKEFFQKLWSSARNGKIWRDEIRNKAKDGSYFWVDTTIVPFLDSEGKPFQFITVRKDITERKIAEAHMAAAVERYNIIAEATSDTIWDLDVGSGTMMYNDGITKMFGYETAGIETNIAWWKSKLHTDDCQLVTDALTVAFKKMADSLQLSYRFRCADGSFKSVFDRAFISYGTKGKPARMVGAMQDITYQVQEGLRIDKAIIDAQERERQYLGAELHDNINQILTSASLILGMAEPAELDASQRTGFITRAMEHIKEAIKETRQLSHEFAPAIFNESSLKDLFEDLLVTMNLDNRLATTLSFSGFDNAVIPYDIQINLYRILQEQTKNILKYAEANKINVTVKAANNTITMRIIDDGKGFDANVKKRGIGLSNIKKRAESLSGKYLLSSAPGKGCAIVVEFPLTSG